MSSRCRGGAVRQLESRTPQTLYALDYGRGRPRQTSKRWREMPGGPQVKGLAALLVLRLDTQCDRQPPLVTRCRRHFGRRQGLDKRGAKGGVRESNHGTGSVRRNTERLNVSGGGGLPYGHSLKTVENQRGPVQRLRRGGLPSMRPRPVGRGERYGSRGTRSNWRARRGRVNLLPSWRKRVARRGSQQVPRESHPCRPSSRGCPRNP